jgi:hypothetical protein
MNWGNWIVGAFILFALFIGVLVTISMRQEVSLVSTSYYADDLSFQQQLERKNNYEQLIAKPTVKLESQLLVVNFPEGRKIEKGEIKLFRPSGDAFDQQFPLSTTTDTVQVFTPRTLEKGAYRAKMTWTMDGKEYYLETFLVQ